MLTNMINFINQNWIGSLIGLIGLIVAYILYRASRIGVKPVFQVRALHLIGSKNNELPGEVTVLFKDKRVQRLTKTYIVLWNEGKAVLKGEDIVVDDPLRLEFTKNSQVLSARVVKETHKPNKFTPKIDEQYPNKIYLCFDYLNSDDGVVLEILHTADERYPSVLGSIKGIPKGFINWGDVSNWHFPYYLVGFSLFNICAGVFFIITGINPSIIVKLDEWSVRSDAFKGISISFGVLWCIVFLLILIFSFWNRRKRFPKSLMIEDFEH